MDNISIFSKRLKESRLLVGMSQAELAQKAGTTSATISAYENLTNIKKPSLDLAINFARELNVSMDWLCGLDTEKLVDKETFTNFDSKTYLYSLVRVLSNSNDVIPCDDYDSHISDFISNVKNLLELYKNNQLSKDLYITCIDKIVQDHENLITFD